MEHKIGIPAGCTATLKIEDGFAVITVEEKFEFKDGDFIFIKDEVKDEEGAVVIYSHTKDSNTDHNTMCYHAMLSCNDLYIADSAADLNSWDILRPATDAEKQQLLDAIAAEGKRWNAEEKCIENIKFKPTLNTAYYYPVFRGKALWASRIWRNEEADKVLFEAGMCCNSIDDAIALSNKILAD